MSVHYARVDRTVMDAWTLLAADPVHWRTFAVVIEDDG